MYHIIFSAAGLVQVHVFDFFFPIFSTLCRERGVVVEGSRLKIRNDKMTTKTIASTAVFFVKPHARKHIICQSSPISSLAGQKTDQKWWPISILWWWSHQRRRRHLSFKHAKNCMAEWHAVASLVVGITLHSGPKQKKCTNSVRESDGYWILNRWKIDKLRQF